MVSEHGLSHLAPTPLSARATFTIPMPEPLSHKKFRPFDLWECKVTSSVVHYTSWIPR